MYGIFTYMTGWFLGQMLVNITAPWSIWLRSLRSICGLRAKETLTPIPLNIWGILRRQTHINQLRWPGKLFTAARWVPVRRHDECALFVSPFHTVWRIGSAWRLWIWNDLNCKSRFPRNMGGLHILNFWNWTSAAMAVFPRVYHSLRHKIVGVLLLICVCFPLESLSIGIGKDIHKWLFHTLWYICVCILSHDANIHVVCKPLSQCPDTQYSTHFCWYKPEEFCSCLVGWRVLLSLTATSWHHHQWWFICGFPGGRTPGFWVCCFREISFMIMI